MNKHLRIAIWVLAGLMLVLVAGFMCADAIVSRLVNNRVQEQLQATDRFAVTYGSLAVHLCSRTIELEDISFSTHLPDKQVKDEPSAELHVSRVEIKSFRLRRMIKDQLLHIGCITVDNPQIVFSLPEDKRDKPTQTDTAQVQPLLKAIIVDAIRVNDGSLQMTTALPPVQLKLDDLQLAIHGVTCSLTDKELVIDSIFAEAPRTQVLADTYYKAKKPFPMPQEKMLAMPMRMRINTIQVALPQADIAVRMPDAPVGHLGIRKARATITNVSNHPGDKMEAGMHASLSRGGEGDFALTMTMDKAAHFNVAADLKQVKGESFNNFLHPLFGAEAAFVINRLTTRYAGNKHRADGTFCMTYDDIQVHIFKEDTPYKLIAQNAGVINAFAPAVLQRRNPRLPGMPAQTYEVGAKRNEMKIFAIYLIGPLMDGALKTLLPGVIVRQIDKKTAGM